MLTDAIVSLKWWRETSILVVTLLLGIAGQIVGL